MSTLSETTLASRSMVSPLAEDAIQPNGIDIRVDAIARFNSSGVLSVDNRDRVLSDTQDIPWNQEGRVFLFSGIYLVRFRERISLPLDTMGYLHPRSSLLRMGAALGTAVWDAGYVGHGMALLIVHNNHGITIERGARIAQMTFHTLDQAVSEGYDGIYQGK